MGELREATLRVVVVSANNVVIEVDKIASRASDCARCVSFGTIPASRGSMTDPATPVQPDDQPLSNDQLSQIAGGRGGTISTSFACGIGTCKKSFSMYDELLAHQAEAHP